MQEGRKILIVDDVGYFAKALAGTLNKAGYIAVHADTVLQALTLLESQSFDLVLTDVRMPGGSGVGLTREIRKKFNIPVVMMSGHDRDLQSLIQEGAAAAFLLKPFSNTELFEALNFASKKAA